MLLVGALAMVESPRRSLTTGLIVLAVVASVTLSLVDAAARFTESETVRELISTADRAGYGSAPVFMFEKVERTSEFYAAGRVAYKSDGEPVMFELTSQIVNQTRQTRGPILVLLRPRSVSQLTSLKEVDTTVIGTNGRTTLVAVSGRQ